MRTNFHSLLSSLIVLALLSEPGFAGHRTGNAAIPAEAPLPASFETDYKIATSARSTTYRGRTLLSSGELTVTGSEVFSSLIASPQIAAANLPFQWNFTIESSPTPNAYALPDGEVTATTAMAQLIGTDRGLWAAVLSHEITHVLRRHAARKYYFHQLLESEIAQFRNRARFGNKSAGWAALALQIAAPMAENKLSRMFEQEADVQGMRMMVQAGYHPDYVFALHHMLRIQTGEESKLAAFFSTHPRWETRDRRADTAYVESLAEYSRLWPNSEQSPGGAPPMVAFVGKAVVTKENHDGFTTVSVPVSCRNTIEPVAALVTFGAKSGAHGPVIRQDFICLDKEDSTPLLLHVPASAAIDKTRRMIADVRILTSDGKTLEATNHIGFEVPKLRQGSADAFANIRLEAPGAQGSAVFIDANRQVEDRTATDAGVLVAKNNASIRTEAPLPSMSPHVPVLPSRIPGVQQVLSLEALGLQGSAESVYGFLVTSVRPSSVAADAGLSANDFIVRVGNTEINSSVKLLEALASSGQEATLTVGNVVWLSDHTVEKHIRVADAALPRDSVQSHSD